jgi:hypothetical protein
MVAAVSDRSISAVDIKLGSGTLLGSAVINTLSPSSFRAKARIEMYGVGYGKDWGSPCSSSLR